MKHVDFCQFYSERKLKLNLLKNFEISSATPLKIFCSCMPNISNSARLPRTRARRTTSASPAATRTRAPPVSVFIVETAPAAEPAEGDASRLTELGKRLWPSAYVSEQAWIRFVLVFTAIVFFAAWLMMFSLLPGRPASVGMVVLAALDLRSTIPLRCARFATEHLFTSAAICAVVALVAQTVQHMLVATPESDRSSKDCKLTDLGKRTFPTTRISETTIANCVEVTLVTIVFLTVASTLLAIPTHTGSTAMSIFDPSYNPWLYACFVYASSHFILTLAVTLIIVGLCAVVLHYFIIPPPPQDVSQKRRCHTCDAPVNAHGKYNKL